MKRLTKLLSFTESIRRHPISESLNRHRGHKIKVVSSSDGTFNYEISSLIEGQPPIRSADGFASEEVAVKSAQTFIDDYQQNFVSSEHSIVSQEDKLTHKPTLNTY
jgi:hypothetical protein